MPKAATHTGSCQCCGKWHKLPDGVLAKHGYQVIWSHFNGVCRGSDELPFEESCALIERFIAEAEQCLEQLNAQCAELRKPASQPRAWYHEFVNRTRARKGGHQWREVDLIDDDGVILFINIDGKPTRIDTYGKSLLEVATILNERRAKALAPDIQRVQTYIAWQNQRVAQWQPGDTKPLVSR